MSKKPGKITIIGVYARVKVVIAIDLGLNIGDIRADDELYKDPPKGLGYDSASIIVLLGPLTQAFAEYKIKLKATELRKCKTVREIAYLIFGKIPPQYQKPLS